MRDDDWAVAPLDPPPPRVPADEFEDDFDIPF